MRIKYTYKEKHNGNICITSMVSKNKNNYKCIMYARCQLLQNQTLQNTCVITITIFSVCRQIHLFPKSQAFALL